MSLCQSDTVGDTIKLVKCITRLGAFKKIDMAFNCFKVVSRVPNLIK